MSLIVIRNLLLFISSLSTFTDTYTLSVPGLFSFQCVVRVLLMRKAHITTLWEEENWLLLQRQEELLSQKVKKKESSSMKKGQI